MKAAVCIVLTLALVSLPSGQVLAQSSPEDATAADVSLVPEEGSQHVPGVSAPSPPAVLLWRPIVENRTIALEEPSFEAPPVPAWSDWSTEKKVLVVGGGVLALIILGIVSIG